MAPKGQKAKLESNLAAYKFPVWNPRRSGTYDCPQIWEVESYLLGLEQAGEIKVFREATGGKGAQFYYLQIKFSGPVMQKTIDETLQKRFYAVRGLSPFGFEPYDYNRS